MAEKRGLGRGLSALIGDTLPPDNVGASETGAAPRADRQIPIEMIDPNPDQPRRDFDQAELESLANSISEKGVIQPIIVRTTSNGRFQIVAGERRWRASQIAKLHEVPVVVRSYTDEEVLEIAIIENVQRTDLNPVEEALGYRQLMDRFGHTQEQLAKALSKSRSHIANQIRLLGLPEKVLDMLRNGDLTAGHARALVTAQNPLELARQILSKGLSVRQVEQLSKSGPKVKTQGAKSPGSEKDADTIALERDLSATLGMPVSIEHRGEGGSLVVRYKNLDDLDELCQAISGIEKLAR